MAAFDALDILDELCRSRHWRLRLMRDEHRTRGGFALEIRDDETKELLARAPLPGDDPRQLDAAALQCAEALLAQGLIHA